jgi:hypothetical protein
MPPIRRAIFVSDFLTLVPFGPKAPDDLALLRSQPRAIPAIVRSGFARQSVKRFLPGIA